MQIAIALYPRLTALDALGPYAVLSQIPGSGPTVEADVYRALQDARARSLPGALV